MRKLISLTAAAAVIAAATLSAASAQQYYRRQAQPVPHQPGYYYSPTDPRGYDYGYSDADPMATGSIMPRGWEQTGPVPGQTWIGYCSAKYPTYDKTSNTFWGPDGQQYLCQ